MNNSNNSDNLVSTQSTTPSLPDLLPPLPPPLQEEISLDKQYLFSELKQLEKLKVNAKLLNHSTNQIWVIPYFAFGPESVNIETFEGENKIGDITLSNEEMKILLDRFSILQEGLEDNEVQYCMR